MMRDNQKKMSKRVLSFLMAFLFIALSAPFVFAAEPIQLTEANVVTWPTIEGELYYGQKLSDGFTLSGGLVTTTGDETGTPVSGTFEFIDPNYVPTSTTGIAAFKFTPNAEYSDEYLGFEVKYVWDVTYSVKAVTPVLVDENNPPIVAEAVEYDTMLRNVVITGGQMKNPVVPTESSILSKKWTWANARTKVTKSGYYPAKFAAGTSGYEVLETEIYVRIAGETPESEIETLPAIELTYNPDITWDKLTFSGGKAVIIGTSTEVSGTFAPAENWNNVVPTVGNYEIDVKFTPTDETVALPYEFKCPVTVNKAVPAFKSDDESGIPTITMPYGTKLDSSLDHKIKPLIDVGVPVSLAYKDLDGNNLSYSGTTPVVGTHEIQVRVNIDNTNYEQFTMLTFNLEITGFTANCIMVPVGTEGYKIIDQNLAYNATKPTGTYTVSYTIDGEKQPDITVKYEELFKIDMTKSGKYEYSIKYNEIENDPFEIDSFTFSSEEKLDRNVKIGDSIQQYTYGDKVTAVAPATDPSMPDKPYYGFAGWEAKGIELTDEQISSPEITFDMPDEDVELNATYKFSMKLFFEWIWQQIVQFFTFFINAMKDLFALSVA